MTLYYITDRFSCPGDVLDSIESAARAGVDLIQIREKDLNGGDLLALATGAKERVRPWPSKLLINERADVALAAGLDGVHLPSNAVAPSRIRQLAPARFLIGVSCHTQENLTAASESGADFAVFGPVFDTPSKRAYGRPAGVPELHRVCAQAKIPVLALGGISESRASQCITAGASGLAAISMFQGEPSVTELVGRLRV